MSNGNAAIVKSFEQQQKGVQKLFIEDWRRKHLAYDVAFMGESHHLIQEEDNFRIVKNKPTLYEPKKPQSKYSNFAKSVPRRQELNTLSESRFDII